MSIQQSRFSGQQVVNAFNIFIDSEKSQLNGGDENNKGDNLRLHMENYGIEAGDGELIRLTLIDFNMNNVLYDVNHNNRRFTVRGTGAAAQAFNDVLFLDSKNHRDLGSIAANFTSKIADYLVAKAVLNGASAATQFVASGQEPEALTTSNEPTCNGIIGNTGDRVFRVVLECQNSGGTAIAHNLTELHIQFPEASGECYNLMGGERNDDGTADQDGMAVTLTINSSKAIQIVGYYPMQRRTENEIYLRCDMANNALMTSNLNSSQVVGQVDKAVTNGNILGKIPFDRDDEIIRYSSRTEKEFFIDLYHKRLASLQLSLTNSRGAPLGRLYSNRTTNTASGDGIADAGYVRDTQTNLGNLFFNATIRAEIVQVKIPNTLDTPAPPIPLPAREGQVTGVLDGSYYQQPRGVPFRNIN